MVPGKSVVLFLTSLMLFLSTTAFGFFKTLPSPDKVEFYLLTVDIGSGLEQRFGHTILRVSHPPSGEEYLLNWGTFDFDDPYFVINFLRGKLHYWVSESGLQQNLYHYENIEHRTVWQDQLNLSTLQKERLLEILVEDLQPENKYFWYDFFYNNCSTIPRDIFNKLFAGQLEAIFNQKPAKMNLRAYVRRDLNEWPFITFFLDIMLNDEVDKPINAWVELFHPLEVRYYFMQLPRFAENGTAIPGSRLLSDPRVLVQAQEHPRSPHSLFPWVFAVSSIWLLLAHLLVLLGRHGREVKVRKMGRTLGIRVFELYSFLWSLLSGSLGTVLVLGWLLSNHTMLYHNANLWLFWPFDLGVAYLSLKRLFGRSTPQKRWEDRLALAHLVCSFLYLVQWFFDAYHQDVENVALFLAPIHVFYWMAQITLRKIPHTTENI